MRSALLLSISLLLSTVAAQDGAAENPKTIDVTISTSLGEMVFELDAAAAPITVGNFLRYAKEKHYDGTIFHRVLKDFMAQGGGFDTGLQFRKARDPIPNEAANGLKNVYGTLAMARTSDPHSATSQFFINCTTNGFLDHKAPDIRQFGYCVFGKLKAGQDVLDALRAVPVERNTKVGNEVAYPVEQVVIESVTFADATRADTLIASAGEALERRAAEQRTKAEAALRGGIALVAKDHDISTCQTLASGLWVLDIVQGEGTNPGPTDRVKVHYTGWLADGTKFDSSRDRGEPITFGLNQVIAGWTEGVGGMRPGGRRLLVIPYQMAYGEAGRPPKIPRKATLVFDVELIEVVK